MHWSIRDALFRMQNAIEGVLSNFPNRAIAWMLKNFGIIDGEPMATLENYFRQCSILVDCRDLAYMGATLANDGVHPLTGTRAMPPRDAEQVLSVMATCGLYDDAGALALDGNGNLFGTTHDGGTGNPQLGTVFKQRGKTHTVLYSFCAISGCVDGAGSYGGAILDEAGNVYGTTLAGGTTQIWGTVFKVTP